MTMPPWPLPLFVVFPLLFLAMLLALTDRKRLAALAATASVLLACVDGQLGGAGVAALFVGAALVLGAHRLPAPRWRGVSFMALAVLSLALGFHLLPGFRPTVLMDGFGREPTHPLAWSLDKGLGGLLLLLVLPMRPGQGAFVVRVTTLLAGVTLLLLATCVAGLGRWDPCVLPGFAFFVLGNGFLTVFAEEAFFRGLLLRTLLDRFGARGARAAASLVAVSVLFALVHAPWGAMFAALAGLAGLFYGFMLLRHGLAWAILAHAVFNAVAVLLLRSPLA